MTRQSERVARLNVSRLPSKPETWSQDEPWLALSKSDRERLRTFRADQPRALFLHGRLLAAATLSELFPVDRDEWRFEATDSGRPEANCPSLDSTPHFSIAHTQRLAVCLATRSAVCGVDVEPIDRRIDALQIAERRFAPTEIEDLRRNSGAELANRFFAYWTLKEAYLKARGEGIRMGLQALTVEFDKNGQIRPHFTESTGDRPSAWQFALYRVDRYLIGVAIECPDGLRTPIEIGTMTPAGLVKPTESLRLIATS